MQTDKKGSVQDPNKLKSFFFFLVKQQLMSDASQHWRYSEERRPGHHVKDFQGTQKKK